MNEPKRETNQNATTDPLADIQARLRKVERQNRLLLTLCCGVIGIAVLTAGTSKWFAPEIRAMQFVLVDGKDKPIAYWGATNGYPVLVFNGKNEVQRPESNPVYLAGSSNGVVMYLNGASPGPESTITIAAGSNAYFSMASPDRGIFEVSPTSATQMSFKTVNNGELDNIFILQNSELGLYNLPLRIYNGQTNVVYQIP